MKKSLKNLMSTGVFNNPKALVLACFIIGGLFVEIDCALGQESLAVESQIPFHPLSLDGSNFLKQTYLSWTDVPFKASRRFYYRDKIGLNYYDEIVQVKFSRSKKKERFFFQKVIRENLEKRFNGKDAFSSGVQVSFNEGFNFKYRDFRVADPVLAKKNYFVIPMGKVLTLNRQCGLFLVKPKEKNKFSFLVVGDLKTAIVVSYYCFNSDGSIKYALISLDLNLGNFEKNPNEKWWRPKFSQHQYSNLFNVFDRFGFKVSKYPKPAHGFVLQKVKTLLNPVTNKTWINLHYSDGILSRFLLFGKKEGGRVSFVERNRNIFKEIKRDNYYQVNSVINGLDLVCISQTSFQQSIPGIMLSLF